MKFLGETDYGPRGPWFETWLGRRLLRPWASYVSIVQCVYMYICPYLVAIKVLQSLCWLLKKEATLNKDYYLHYYYHAMLKLFLTQGVHFREGLSGLGLLQNCQNTNSTFSSAVSNTIKWSLQSGIYWELTWVIYQCLLEMNLSD